MKVVTFLVQEVITHANMLWQTSQFSDWF